MQPGKGPQGESRRGSFLGVSLGESHASGSPCLCLRKNDGNGRHFLQLCSTLVQKQMETPDALDVPKVIDLTQAGNSQAAT